MSLDSKGQGKKLNNSALYQDKSGLTAIAASLLRVDQGVSSILITSCRAREGKTVTAVNIARALVEEAGKSILLIDGNHDAPGLHQYYQVEASPGFSDLVHGRVTKDEVIRRDVNESLSLVSAGSKEQRNLDFYRSHHFKEVLSDLSEGFDLVIYDGPAIFGRMDSATISPAFGGVVIVIECEKTPWEVLQSGKQRLEEMGAQIMGAVMNKRKFYIPRGLYV